MCGGVRASQRLTELLKHTQNMAQRLNAADSRRLWGLGLEEAGGVSQANPAPPTPSHDGHAIVWLQSVP